MSMDPGAIRNFKDFLLLYNKLSEMCFSRCVDNVNSRTLDPEETECVEDCTQKFIYFNKRLMTHFVEAQSNIVNKRVQEVEAEQKKMVENVPVQEDNKVATPS